MGNNIDGINSLLIAKSSLYIGLREASINKAEGEKRSKILVSEANQLEQINKAQGEAEAIAKIAQAKAESIRVVAKALAENVWIILLINLSFRIV